MAYSRVVAKAIPLMEAQHYKCIKCQLPSVIHILPSALKAHQSTEDVAVPVEVQQMLIQGAEDAGTNVTSKEIKSGHGVILCRPKEVVEFITEAAAALHETRQ
jgi:hypothetical protein